MLLTLFNFFFQLESELYKVNKQYTGTAFGRFQGHRATTSSRTTLGFAIIPSTVGTLSTTSQSPGRLARPGEAAAYT